MSLFDTLEKAKQAIRPYCYSCYEDLILNMNDTWGWAVAHGEPVSENKILELADLIWRYGNAGVLYWVSEQNDQMRSEFKDINRFIDFVRHEEQFRKDVPESTKRAYQKLTYKLG